MPVQVPDFDDMLKLANRIKVLTARKIMIDVELKARESEITTIMTTDKNYYQNGKPPSISMIENTYKYTGFRGELLSLRKEFAEVSAELEECKLRFDIYKMQLDLYRTEAANQRLTSL